MREKRALIVFLLLSVHLTSASTTQGAQLVHCTGRVADVQGRPFAGARVVAYEMVSDGVAGNIELHTVGEVITQDDGAFTFQTEPRLRRGIFLDGYVVATKQDLALGWAVWNMRENAEVTVELGQPEELEGVIVDEMGKPIVDAEVRVNILRTKTASGGQKREWLPGIAPIECLATRTDHRGRFRFDNIPPGSSVDLLITAAGRATTYTYDWGGPPRFKDGAGPRFQAGQTDIRVVLPAEGRIEARIVDSSTGKAVQGIKLAVVPTFSPAFFVRFVCVSKEDGSFDIGGLQTGRYLIRNGVPQTYVEVESGRTASDVMIECPAVLQGRVTGPDGKPLANIEVQIRGKEELGERAIAGANVKTDEDGHYYYPQIDWPYVVGFLWSEDMPGGRGQRSQYLRLHQLLNGSQTVNFQFQEFPEGAAGLSMQVTDQHGRAVRDFVVDTRNVVDWKDYSRDLYQYCYNQSLATTDGTFELSNLPGGVYWVTCLARGEWKGYKFPESQQVTLQEGKTANITCQVLKKTARYGRILFEDGAPAIADIPWSGAGEEISVSSPFGDNDSPVDREGYFTAYLTDDEIEKVKSGKARMEISYPSHDEPHTRYAVGVFPGELLSRDKNGAGVVKIPKPIYKRKIDVVNAPSLMGKPLPELKDLKIELSATAAVNKMILICFWDMEQRPSRHLVSELVKRAKDLKRQRVTVVAVQATKMDEDTLNEWVKKYNISFPVGTAEGNVEKARFTWGVRSLPWLILTDRNDVVIAEGFGLSELNENIKEALDVER